MLMKELRLLMFLMICLCLYIPAKAETGQMIATMKNGKTVTVDLADGMVGEIWYDRNETEEQYVLSVYTGPITYENGRPVAQEGGKIWFESPMPDIANIDFSGLASIGAIQADNGISVDVAGGKVSVTGVNGHVTATVYSLDGIVRDSFTLTQDAVIDLNLYGAGMHIVKVGNTTFKIVTK